MFEMPLENGSSDLVDGSLLAFFFFKLSILFSVVVIKVLPFHDKSKTFTERVNPPVLHLEMCLLVLGSKYEKGSLKPCVAPKLAA